MKNFCENLIKNEIRLNILKDYSLFSCFNKQELYFLYFYFIKNHAFDIRFIDNPTEEMQLLAMRVTII